MKITITLTMEGQELYSGFELKELSDFDHKWKALGEKVKATVKYNEGGGNGTN